MQLLLIKKLINIRKLIKISIDIDRNIVYILLMENINIPKEPTERWEWIKYQLRLKGYSLRRLGKEHGVTGKAVEAVVRQNAPKWERIISGMIGLQPQEIWPERYGSDGLPIRHSSRYQRKDNTSRITRQRLTKGRV